jgi:site-specific DNA recombinase
LDESKNKLSNPEKVINRALEICSNLSELWVSGGYDNKVQLQNMMFPEGILYDRRNDNYRTEKVNMILELTHSFSNSFGQKKNGQTKKAFDLPGLVALIT